MIIGRVAKAGLSIMSLAEIAFASNGTYSASELHLTIDEWTDAERRAAEAAIFDDRDPPPYDDAMLAEAIRYNPQLISLLVRGECRRGPCKQATFAIIAVLPAGWCVLNT